MGLPASLRFALRQFRRDARAGGLTLLLAALTVAVGCVTAVGFFVDRVDRGLQQRAATLLGADLVIRSSRPIGNELAAQARQLGLRTARVVQFRTMAMLADRPQLVEVKAAGPGYPLRGTLETSPSPEAPPRPEAGLPERGVAWVAPRLAANAGETGAEIALGAARFRIGRLLRFEPDRGGDLFSIAPRVLIPLADLPATELLGPGALVEYRLLLAGPPAAVERARRQLAARLGEGEKLLSVREGRPELRTALERAERFLGLAALVSVLLAGVTVAIAARHFATLHLDTSALLRAHGASGGFILRGLGLEMLLLVLTGGTLGALAGLAAQAVIGEILAGLFLARLPPPHWLPLLDGYATALVLLLGFGLPPIARLRHVPPLRVLRRDLLPKPASGLASLLAVILAIGLYLWLRSGDPRLVVTVLGGALAAAVMLSALAWLLIRLTVRLQPRFGPAVRQGLAAVTRHPGASLVTVGAFGLVILAVLLLSVVRGELLRDWQRSLPPDAPNHFLINVQTDQRDALTAFFRRHELPEPTLHPMVRARLLRIGERPVRAADYTDPRARHLATREFNLSWSERPGPDNRLTAGRWWTAAEHGAPQLSLETGIARTLGIALGDTLTFDVNGQPRTFTVTSLREVDWDSFRVNFFTLVPPGVLDDAPASWVTSVHLTEAQRRHLPALQRTFPNVTVIDVDAIMARVRAIMTRVALAVEFLFLFSLLAAMAILLAVIRIQQAERRQAIALLRSLGASRRFLQRRQLAEFTALGLLAGLLGGLAATLLAWLAATGLFHFPYTPSPAIPLAGLAAGILLLPLAGYPAMRRLLAQPPMAVLRREAA